MKIINWISENILFLITLFLLAFIPLYPKIPLIDVKNTWVYIRVEDFLILGTLFVWVVQIIRGKASLKTPLTMPILIFWLVGAVATIHAILIIFPTLANVFSNTAFLSYLRRIEYISLFFVAYAAMREKKFLNYVIATLVITLFLVVGYGIGQRFFGFPAFLTMNEEFAKGVPIQLSQFSRIPSTFAGHYDLAAYLVLIIPILTSLIFGFKRWLIRGILSISVLFGFVLLFMTVSRASFFVLPISIIFVLLFHFKRKFLLLSVPVLALFLVVLSLNFSQSLLNRFGSTVKEVNVLVDAKTGYELGQVKTVSSTYLADKLIRQTKFVDRQQLSIGFKDTLSASISAIPLMALPKEVVMVVPPEVSTGENLTQGTGYINLSLSPVTQRLGDFFLERPESDFDKGESATVSAKITRFHGQFLVKKVATYDLSFSTRYQGEWPNAVRAFKRNILFGSGYSSVSLAVDNSFLRMLAEVGISGFVSFVSILLIFGIYVKKVLPQVESRVAKGFILGFCAGVIGLCLNATLIDVFEASKVAYTMWLLMGVVVGLLHLYQAKPLQMLQEFKNLVTSSYAIIIYIILIGVLLYSPMVRNYFVGDDFTWLRWAADCNIGNVASATCPSFLARVTDYFTNADGFFYRPGTKTYFLLMYQVFWLNQSVYHIVSIGLHIIVTILLYLLTKSVLRNNLLAAGGAFLFLILSGYSENVFWISSTGNLFNVAFILLSLLCFVTWEKKKKILWLLLSILSASLSLLFHELGVVIPVLIILYKALVSSHVYRLRPILKHLNHNFIFFIPVIFYAILRIYSNSHWFSGDYSYNVWKLPFNIIGNSIGYFVLSLLGPIWLSFYEVLRVVYRQNIVFALLSIGLLVILVFLVVKMRERLKKVYEVFLNTGQAQEGENRKVVVFATLLFIVALLPFLGLGNIASRYSYLASGGFVLIFVFFLSVLYRYLLVYGREIALASLSVVIGVFVLLHIIQIQQAHSDWYEAGKKTENFIVSIDSLFDDYWSTSPLEFHFVNVPILHGNAWIFPVGLKDALWLIFRNSNIAVYQDPTVSDALSAVKDSKNEKIFLFEDDGKVVEIRRIKNTDRYYKIIRE